MTSTSMEDVQLPDGHKFPLLPCDLNVIFEIFSREACVGLLGLFSQSADDLLDLGADIGSATAWYLENGIGSDTSSALTSF